MAVYDDRVAENCTASGTTITLTGAWSTGVRTFAQSNVGNGNPCRGVVVEYLDPTTGKPEGEWALVDGTYNSGPGTITITTWRRSSAGGGAVTWTPGRTYRVSMTPYTDDALAVFTSTASGRVPASGGGTTNFLRADGTWAAPGGTPGGSNTQLQYNNAGAFAGMSGWSWADGTKQLTLTGVGFRQSAVSANYFTFINAAGNEVASINDAGVSSGFWNLSIPATNAGWRITAAASGTLILSSGLGFTVQTTGTVGSLTVDNTKFILSPSVSGSTVAEQIGGINGASSGAQFQTLHKERWWTFYWNGVHGFNNHTFVDVKLVGQSTTPNDSLYQIISAGLGLTLLSLNTLNGNLAFADGASLIAGTTNGLKIGSATSQKLGFWNATPIVQPTTGVAAATLVSNAGTTLTDTDTFDGYTLKQVVKALRNMGALA